jgi:ATP-dependent DNA helicase RecQ
VTKLVEESVELDDDGRQRFERLRVWRSGMARERGVPAYVIFHDSTLRAIAARAPRDIMELGRIKGVGPGKVTQFGQSLLEAVRQEA